MHVTFQVIIGKKKVISIETSKSASCFPAHTLCDIIHGLQNKQTRKVQKNTKLVLVIRKTKETIDKEKPRDGK